MQTTAVKRVKLLIKRVTNGNLANTCLSAAIFLSGGRLGKLCYEQTISTWVVKSDLLIGVKLKHVLTMGDKSPEIRTPLYKDTNIVPNDYCRICRINVKISGRSKINVFSPFPFLWNNGARKSHAAQQTLKVRNVLSEVFVDLMPKITLVRSLKINIGRRRKMQAAPKMITYLYKVVCFFFLQGNFHSVFGDLYFAAINKLVYLME